MSDETSDFDVYLMSEEIAEKLKLLDYEKELISRVDGAKIIPRLANQRENIFSHYFSNSTNVGEQFFMFQTIAVWLLSKAGWKDLATPSEFDDPNTVISLITEGMRSNGLEPPASAVASRLRSGAGRPVMELLLCLIDFALKSQRFEFKQKIIPTEAAAANSDDQMTVEQLDEENEAEAEEEEVAAADDEDNILSGQIESRAADLDVEGTPPLAAVLHTVTEQNALRDEIERILPQLRVTIRAADKHWRLHDEQLQRLNENTKNHFDAAKPVLSQIGAEIAQTVDRIQTRERHLNEQLSGVLNEHRHNRNSLAEIREKYRAGLESRQETLQRIGDEIDQIKQQIEEQGAQNANGTPMLKVQQAIARLEKSIITMSVQTAAIEQSLNQRQLTDRAANVFSNPIR